MKIVLYIGVVLLLLIILLQNKGCKRDESISIPKVDTVVIYKTIHDTIPGKPIYLKTKIDTSIWIKKKENTPDTTYKGLLFQYRKLGNDHFSTNVFKTDFKIADYGYISVTDTIRENRLIGNSVVTNLKIPITTVTIEKPSPLKRTFYIGGEISTGKSPLYGGFLLKNKKGVIYGASFGYDNKIVYKGSVYFPLNK